MMRLGMLVLIVSAGALAGCSGESTEDAELAASIAALEQAVADAERKIERLKDFDAIENLSSAYGHYVDESMHDDVADLFAADGIVEILGRGVYYGQDRVRQYMRNLSPIGQQNGVLFNHMHLQPVIHVADDGQTANARSRIIIMFDRAGSDAQWGSGIYENEFVKEDGIWKFRYLHAYHTFYTNYDDGWAKNSLPFMPPYQRLPPDNPQSVAYEPWPAPFVPPFHYANPVTGRRDHYGRPQPPPAPAAAAPR